MPNTRTILIVDDDAELREALTEQLSLHEEFEAVAVENGTKAVQAAKAGQIDLVIMDVGLPDIDGREAVRILSMAGSPKGLTHWIWSCSFIPTFTDAVQRRWC